MKVHFYTRRYLKSTIGKSQRNLKMRESTHQELNTLSYDELHDMNYKLYRQMMRQYKIDKGLIS